MRFTDSHEWAEKEEDVVFVGITAAAKEELGDILYLELPKVGKKVKALDAVCIVESAKAAIDLHAPVSGTIVKTHEKLRDNLDNLNKKVESKEHWLFQIKPSIPKEYEELMDDDAYKAWKFSES